MKRTLCRSIAILIYTLATILLLLLIVVPVAVSLSIRFGIFPTGETANWWSHILQNIHLRAMYVVCWAWLFFVGGCFASFLNVVAYRVPRGRSILGSSHCPQCDIKLSFRNNLPILGWLRNGGCCANCNAPIPVRYLMAEIILGSIFLLLFATQTLTGGATLPFLPTQPAGMQNLLMSPPVDLLIVLGFHLTLLSLVFTIALIASEKFPTPVSVVAFGLLAALAFQLLPYSPGILSYRLTSLGSGSDAYLHLLSNWREFAISIAIGVCAAALCFAAITFAKLGQTNGVFAGLLLIAVFLGWQATLSVTIIFLVLCCIGVTGGANVLVSTIVHLCLWRFQTFCSWWPSPGSDYPQLIAAVCYIVVIVFVVRILNSRQKDPHRPSENLPIVDSDLQ